MKDEEMFIGNLELQRAFMQYILDKPDVLDRMPEEYRLVILPDDDPELGWKNLQLLREQGDPGKPIVIVRMQTRNIADLKVNPPEIYIPIAA